MPRPQQMSRESLEAEVALLRTKRAKQRLAFKMLQSAIDRKNNRIRNLESEIASLKTPGVCVAAK
jgi:chromosome segregation ATPase